MKFFILFFTFFCFSTCFKVITNINNINYSLTSNPETGELLLDVIDGLDFHLEESILKSDDSIVNEIDIILQLIENSPEIELLGSWSIQDGDLLVYSRELFYCGIEAPYNIHTTLGDNCQQLNLKVQLDPEDDTTTTSTSTITVTVTSYSTTTTDYSSTIEEFSLEFSPFNDEGLLQESEITETIITTVTLIEEIITTTTCSETSGCQSEPLDNSQPFNIIAIFNDEELEFTSNGTLITLFDCKPSEFILEDGLIKLGEKSLYVSPNGDLTVANEGTSGWKLIDDKLVLCANDSDCKVVEFKICNQDDDYWITIGENPDILSIDVLLRNSVQSDEIINCTKTATIINQQGFSVTSSTKKSTTFVTITSCSTNPEPTIQEFIAADPKQEDLYTSLTITITIHETVSDQKTSYTTMSKSSTPPEPLAYLLENNGYINKDIDNIMIYCIIISVLIPLFI